MDVITGVATSITVFLGRTDRGPLDEPTTISGYDQFEAQFGGLREDSLVTYAVRDFFLNGGVIAVIVRLGESVPLDHEAYVKGLGLLATVDLFNLVCIPPDRRDGDTDPRVYAAALEVCARMKAMLLIDPPRAWGPNVVETIQPERFAAELGVDPAAESARFAVVYWPRYLGVDPLRDGCVDSFPPSGAVAGVMARSDGTVGVWKAPAGLTAGLSGAVGLATSVSSDDRHLLTSIGVNCLHTVRDVGVVVWGARTLRGADVLADDHKYVSVRRLTSYVEQTLRWQILWAVFEPNDARLWARLRAAIDSFLRELWQQGALSGPTAADAFLVQVDASTTTPDDVELGVVNIVIGLAPVYPSEFIVLYLQQATLAGRP